MNTGGGLPGRSGEGSLCAKQSCSRHRSYSVTWTDEGMRVDGLREGLLDVIYMGVEPKIWGVYLGKASFLIGLSIINNPFWGTIIFGSSQIVKDTSQKTQYTWKMDQSLHLDLPNPKRSCLEYFLVDSDVCCFV